MSCDRRAAPAAGRGLPRYGSARRDGSCAKPYAWLAIQRGMHVAQPDRGLPNMVLASISFRSQPHKRSELLSAVDDTVERMRTSDGCARCRLVVDTEDPNAFTIVSEW